jgi:Putative prokaryotic signal transducing protein
LEVSRDDFRRHFELLSDESLLAINREELVEAARSVYDEEVARRGLTGPLEEAEGESLPGAVPVAASQELVLVASYNIPDEASLARGLLQSAEIPFILQNDYAALGGIELRLLVPKEFQEQAIEILQHEISDEELAAQAEAAGFTDEEYGEEGVREIEGELEEEESSEDH